MALGLGRVLAGVATMGGSEAYRALSKPGQILGPNDVAPVAPADPLNAQFGAGNGTELSNQLAAQQVASGLQQQAGQNEREGAFYNQANSNFDIANAAQMRGGPQITSSLADQQRQIAALGGTNAAIGNVNATGNRLTALGTKPMGDSYAAAQMHQGLDQGMAQQLSMARSGRSLGSGQAAMNQAAFNNAGLSQQTNQSAGIARIQEQNAYNQFQAGALSAAGQQYGQAGALSGQAGTQATGVRQGNENVQLQNAQLGQAQQGINNQTTGLYNNLGATQQGLGMQANANGLSSQQFGQQQGANIMGAQLQANTGLNGTNAQISMANNQQANASETAQKQATIGGVTGLAGGLATAKSDERSKTNVVPLEDDTAPYMPTAPGQLERGVVTEALPEGATATGSPGISRSAGGLPIINPAKLLGGHGGGSPGMQTATPLKDPGQSGKDYMGQIDALNAHYAASQRAPVDVLNHVPGAGAGPSASQSALLAHMGAPRPDNAGPRQYMPPARDYAAAPNPAPLHLPNGHLVTSDQHSKTRIHELEGQLAALSGSKPQQGSPPTARFAPEQPDTGRLDAYAQNYKPPAVDLRPARGYEYEYRDPQSPGAAPGRHFGPMAQDLERTPAGASTVRTGLDGMKEVDTPRLTMVNTAALSEQQRKTDELQRQLDALSGGNGGYAPASYDRDLYRGAGPL